MENLVVILLFYIIIMHSKVYISPYEPKSLPYRALCGGELSRHVAELFAEPSPVAAKFTLGMEAQSTLECTDENLDG